jgi:hypothetical protein
MLEHFAIDTKCLLPSCGISFYLEWCATWGIRPTILDIVIKSFGIVKGGNKGATRHSFKPRNNSKCFLAIT